MDGYELYHHVGSLVHIASATSRPDSRHGEFVAIFDLVELLQPKLYVPVLIAASIDSVFVFVFSSAHEWQARV